MTDRQLISNAFDDCLKMKDWTMRTRPFLIAACLLFSLSAVAVAQRGPQTQTLTGTVKELQEKGRLTTVVVATDDGTEHEFPLTGKIRVEATAEGDGGFVRPGVFMVAQGVLTNNQLFVKEVNILLPAKGQRLPAGRIAKTPPKPGTSENAYDIAGTIVGRQSSPDYPEYQLLALQIAGRTPPILLEKDFTVTVTSVSPEHLQEGASVELEVTPLRGNRINVVTVSVRPEEPFDSTEVFGEAAEEK